MPRPPVWRMSKLEIVRLARWRCRHGETGLSHYNCWLRESGGHERIGFLDIEASNLKADFGILLSYAIADNDSDKVYSRCITKRELASCLDKKLVSECVKDMMRFDRIVGYYSCVTGDERILVSLDPPEWRPVKDIMQGDQIIGVEEVYDEMGYRAIPVNTWVIHNAPLMAKTYTIHLAEGRDITCTNNHPWLVASVIGDNLKELVWEYVTYKDISLQEAYLTSLDVSSLQLGTWIGYEHIQNVPIVGVDPAGMQEVWGLGTTCETYIVDTFPCHNTRFDIPFLRTRAVIHGLPFPEYGELCHTDIYQTVRTKFKLSRNRLDTACEVLLGGTVKTRIHQDFWVKALMGDKKALDYILDHNIKDVMELKRLYNQVVKFRTLTHTSV